MTENPTTTPAMKSKWNPTGWSTRKQLIVGGCVAAFFLIGIVSSGEDPATQEGTTVGQTVVTSLTDAAIETAPPATEAPATTAAPTTAPPVTEPPAPEMTPSQSNAVRSAESYLDYSNFSRLGLIDQLEYEQFSTDDATFAVDYVDADWMAQAAGSAESYLEYSSFSCGSLTDQLEYEKFTPDQAAFGAQSTGIC